MCSEYQQENQQVDQALLPGECLKVTKLCTNADGHRAADWPKDPIWTGKLKITAKGRL